MLPIHHARQETMRLDAAYIDYLAQFEKPRSRRYNPNNLFHDCNLRDRLWLSRARKHIGRQVRRLP